MSDIQININPEVELAFNNYPILVQKQILDLRNLIIETADEIEGLNELEETLKWGEPSYLAKNGSTIRIDWKNKLPDQYAMYFKCTSKLVQTFKIVFKDLFKYENNRALLFQIDDILPNNELKKCISAGLQYHKIKHLPLLGIDE